MDSFLLNKSSRARPNALFSPNAFNPVYEAWVLDEEEMIIVPLRVVRHILVPVVFACCILKRRLFDGNNLSNHLKQIQVKFMSTPFWIDLLIFH